MNTIKLMDSSTTMQEKLGILGLSILLGFTLIFSWGYAPIAYEVNSTDLIIHRKFSNKTIKILQIKTVKKLIKTDLSHTIRTFGVGGLFGYFGRFNSPKLGKLKVYASRWDYFILVQLKDGTNYMFTPDEQDQMEEALQEVLKDHQ